MSSSALLPLPSRVSRRDKLSNMSAINYGTEVVRYCDSHAAVIRSESGNSNL
jgi:hypothetical protein